MTVKFSRRTALTAAAALPLAATARSVSASTSAEMAKAPASHSRSFKLGDFTVTTLLDGSRPVENPKPIFGGGASDAEFAATSAQNFIPADMAQFFFTPTLVDTGQEKILFDTGLGQGGIQMALAEVGMTPQDIDVVVLTHMHPDHIGGMTTEGAETFSNARYLTGRQEFDFWAAQGEGNRIGDLMAKKVTPFAEKLSFLEDGGSVASGISAVASFGHTPGHMGYMLDSGGQQLMLTADLANHYVWSFAHPDWEVKFDMDKSAATASRRKVLDMLASTRTPMIGYHMPFPAAGYVETRGSGFRFVPVSYQMMG
ncbi:metallo-beta-lactamase family protein [Roseobacter sp. MED193]|uniref:MBL fold metallo-hydrolase n=1 Tax=Roseobacter sp. MED193 TaxID=314262 RepID=UPI0000689D47|nr:MBL fold metallo-hydrolase [Roseobacter sp. MED193]EAQ44328.1 metallo-beta-lactamase family protein [Roseobacter sp. MED193]